MATSRLYPTLTKFYERGYRDDEDNSIDRLLSQNQLQRKDNTTNLKPTDKIINSHLDHTNHNKEPQAGMLYPNISQNVQSSNDNLSPHECIASYEEPTVPSAPPIELWDEELLRFLEQALMEQQANSALDDTPTADYSSFMIPSDLLMNETWIDDLLPDYDITQENAETQYLNNLNKADRDKAKYKTANMSKGLGYSVELNIRPESKRPVGLERTDLRRNSRIPESTDRRVLIECRAGCQKDHTGGKENSFAGLESKERSRPAPGSPEYTAWMTWRKQVNRQLATVILLRQGGHVWLQKGDMSRKHLNQRSIDFVSKVVKSGNKTSLGGKPFVMYGIPRASLSASQRELTNIGRH